jgi:N utilization substance protein B
MGQRHRGRELAFQLLFQTDLTGDRINAVVARFQDLKKANAEAAALAEDLAVGAFQAQANTDALIRAAAKNWKLERLLSVDRALLRLGVFELGQRPDTPTEVVLDECIELAKDYGSDESAAFVNGVLDTLARQLRRRPGEDADLPVAAPKRTSTPIPKAKTKAKPKTKAKG